MTETPGNDTPLKKTHPLALLGPDAVWADSNGIGQSQPQTHDSMLPRSDLII